MRKIITITDPMQVKIGDKAYFKDCDFGFIVLAVDGSDKFHTLMVNNPLSGANFWTHSRQFDHATREVKEPEWPDPHDIKLHVYLGADGRRYIYNPTSKRDEMPWLIEGRFTFHSRKGLEVDNHDALPLTELKLVPAKDDDNEQ